MKLNLEQTMLAMAKLNQNWKDRHITVKTKARLLHSVIL